MTDIARSLGISQATVSYVLNGRDSGLVSASTRQRVLNAAQEMGYRRNRAAQVLAGHQSFLIELCVRSFHPAYFSHLLMAFDQQIRPSPYELHIVNLDSVGEDGWTASNGNWPVDGIIADTILPEPMDIFVQRGVPIVSIGLAPSLEVDHVVIDFMPAVMEAVRHMAAVSNRIAFVLGMPSIWGMEKIEPRLQAYSQTMQEVGLTEELIWVRDVEGMTDRSSVREAVRNYVQKEGSPGAIVCVNDETAIATLAALRDLKIRVPQDVMLMGCDGIEETAYHNPPISTIQYPFEEVARLSWNFLRNRIENPKIALQGATLTPALLLRESSLRE